MTILRWLFGIAAGLVVLGFAGRVAFALLFPWVNRRWGAPALAQVPPRVVGATERDISQVDLGRLDALRRRTVAALRAAGVDEKYLRAPQTVIPAARWRH